MISESKYIVIAGPTASGKTDYALKVANFIQNELKVKSEIVSCDTIQIYKDFNIGSAKPTPSQQAKVKHHLIDICSWNEFFDAANYATLARAKVSELQSQGILPIIVGGAGLYLRAFWGENWHEDIKFDPEYRLSLDEFSSVELYEKLTNLDPQRAKQIHSNDRFRICRALEIIQATGQKVSDLTQENSTEIDFHRGYVIYLKPDRSELKNIIKSRVETMLELGLVEEVRNLINKGVSKDCKPMQSIGYLQVVDLLDNKIKPAELLEKIYFATCQYAKRQMTWFNKVNSQETKTHTHDFRMSELLLEYLKN